MDGNIGTSTEMALQAQAIVDRQAPDASSQNVEPDNSSNQEGVKEKAGKDEKFAKAVEVMKQVVSSQKLDESGTSDESAKEETVKNDGTSKEHDYEKRYNDLLSRTDRVADRYVKLAKEAVAKDPTLIHKIAEEDITIADKIVKDELEKDGITSYTQLKEFLENDGKPQEYVELKSEVQEIKKLLQQKTEQETIATVEKFITDHSDINEEMADYMATLVDDKGFELKEAYEYAKFKLGKVNLEKNAEENAYKNIYAQETASSISSQSSIPSKTGATKRLTEQEKSFLEQVGAKKTLAKYI